MICSLLTPLLWRILQELVGGFAQKQWFVLSPTQLTAPFQSLLRFSRKKVSTTRKGFSVSLLLMLSGPIPSSLRPRQAWLLYHALLFCQSFASSTIFIGFGCCESILSRYRWSFWKHYCSSFLSVYSVFEPPTGKYYCSLKNDDLFLAFLNAGTYTKSCVVRISVNHHWATNHMINALIQQFINVSKQSSLLLFTCAFISLPLENSRGACQPYSKCWNWGCERKGWRRKNFF